MCGREKRSAPEAEISMGQQALSRAPATGVEVSKECEKYGTLNLSCLPGASLLFQDVHSFVPGSLTIENLSSPVLKTQLKYFL